VKGGRKNIKYSVGDKGKSIFLDLNIDRSLCNAEMHGTITQVFIGFEI
jgi:hypothetical protein